MGEERGGRRDTDPLDTALADEVRASGASGGLLYVLPSEENALWLAVMTGASREFAGPWLRVSPTDPVPLADAVRERRLVWVDGQEEMARRYPRAALVAPYDFAMAAVPVTAGHTVRGALVLLWPGTRPHRLSPGERESVHAGGRRLGGLLQAAAEAGEALLPDDPPRVLPPPAAHALPPEEAAELAAFVHRLPGGSCALDVDGRVTFVTPAAAVLLDADAVALKGRTPWEALPWLNDAETEESYWAAMVSRRSTAFTALRPPDVWLRFALHPDPSGISLRITPGSPPGGPPPPQPERGTGLLRATVLSHAMQLATKLTEAVGVHDVVEQTADQLLPALGAQAIALMAADDGRLKVLGHRGYPADFVTLFDALPLTVDAPGCRVTASGEACFFTSAADFARAYPSTVRLPDKAAWAFLPLIASRRPIGTLLLAYDRPRPFPPAERAVLTSLAGLVGQALDRARLYDANHDLAHHLQSGLLPHSLPPVPGLAVTARYLPAARGLGVGGDFYDLIHLGARTAAAAIGDVQGHNVDAAALMGQVRTAVHAHATVGAPPDHVLSGANRLLTDLDPGMFTSCLYAHFDLTHHLVCLATAGHPPPLLRHADGRTEILHVPPGLLLGIDPDARYPSVEFPVPPGCVLAFYTDGLIEAPGVDPDDATAALAELLGDCPAHDLDAMADALIRHAPTPGDDIALLLISPRPTGR